MIKLLLLLVAVSAILALAACGGEAQPSNTTPSATQRSTVRLSVPDFKVSIYQGGGVLGGEEAQFSSLFGQGKPVVLNFYAGLCAPCRIEMPEFQETYEVYQERVVFFGLDVGPFIGLGSREDGQALLDELKITYPAGTAFEDEVLKDYKVVGMPTTLFIKSNGECSRSGLAS
jgi:thiol-disulfide isomerase/thioredoxin